MSDCNQKGGELGSSPFLSVYGLVILFGLCTSICRASCALKHKHHISDAYQVTLLIGSTIHNKPVFSRFEYTVLRVHNWFFGLFMILVLGVLSGCLDEPARDHPLDPLGENFLDEGRLSVLVTNFYPPRSGLRDITISLSTTAISGITNDAGMYVADRLPGGMYQVQAQAPGYAVVDTMVQVTAGETTELELPLAGLPTFSNFQVNSLHVSRWFPPPEELFSLEIQAEMADNDGVADIDSLWFSIDRYNYKDLLFVETAPGQYVHSIPVDQLPVGIDALLGQDLRLVAVDRSGTTNISEPVNLIRIIQETPLAIEPQDLTLLTDSLPTFSWEPMSLSFPFTFRVDVVRIDQNIRSIVQTIENIPATTTTQRAVTPISAGEYFWIVSVVDEFGNRSRSREAGFRIR